MKIQNNRAPGWPRFQVDHWHPCQAKCQTLPPQSVSLGEGTALDSKTPSSWVEPYVDDAKMITQATSAMGVLL